MRTRDESGDGAQFVTIMVGGQLFGIPIHRVHDVFVPERLTRVPLAPAEVAGVLNLRGRVLTMVDMRAQLGLEPAPGSKVAVGIEHRGDFYGLIVDGVGEVLELLPSAIEPTPSNLDRLWAGLSAGVCRMTDRLLVILEVDRVLGAPGANLAA